MAAHTRTLVTPQRAPQLRSSQLARHVTLALAAGGSLATATAMASQVCATRTGRDSPRSGATQELALGATGVAVTPCVLEVGKRTWPNMQEASACILL